MRRPALQVVQFVNPGFEYHRQEHLGVRHNRSGVMRWKPGRTRHDRKFMLTWGSLLEPVTGQDHASAPLAFWGEWEASLGFLAGGVPGQAAPYGRPQSVPAGHLPARAGPEHGSDGVR